MVIIRNPVRSLTSGAFAENRAALTAQRRRSSLFATSTRTRFRIVNQPRSFSGAENSLEGLAGGRPNWAPVWPSIEPRRAHNRHQLILRFPTKLGSFGRAWPALSRCHRGAGAFNHQERQEIVLNIPVGGDEGGAVH